MKIVKLFHADIFCDRKISGSGLKHSVMTLLQGVLSILLLSFVVSNVAMAHRGAKNEVDTCRFSVGSEVVHFTAYTPTFSAATGYCQAIPHVGPTHLVFDYEGNKLRNTTVEFEITKEPEGKRVYYQAPEKIKKGSVDAKVDFNQHGAGNYLAHVTIMYQGEKLDSHLPFSVGLVSEDSGVPSIVIGLLSLAVITVIVMIIVSRRKKTG